MSDCDSCKYHLLPCDEEPCYSCESYSSYVPKDNLFTTIVKIKDMFKDTEEVMNSGRKDDTGKAPVVQGFMAYFPRAIKAVAMQSKYGKDKYDLVYEDKNFIKVEDAFNRYDDANGRHMLDRFIDPNGIDPESQMEHLVAEAWNAMAKLEVYLINKAKQENK